MTFDGLPTKDKLNLLTIERGLPKGLHYMINDLKQQYTMEIGHAKCKPLFVHEYALSKLKSEGYRLSVASNSIRQTVDLFMKKSNLINHLDFYLSNEDVKRSKPDPEIYNTAIQKLGLSPKECLIIEDNHNGIIAARNSGANVMIVNNVHDVNYMNIINTIKKIEAE